METDELRKEETQFLVAGCQIEREKQLMDKKSKLEQSIIEEQVYAKLWMLDAEKKAKREQEEQMVKKRKVHETVNILTWQQIKDSSRLMSKNKKESRNNKCSTNSGRKSLSMTRRSKDKSSFSIEKET